MKIIFLDIDGVLNCNTSKSRCGNFIGIDKDKVKRLASIVEQTNAKLVLISDWKIGWEPFKRYDKVENPHAKYLDDHLERKGKLYLIDKTREPNLNLRGSGVRDWLTKHPDVTAWVILDDYAFSDYSDIDIVSHIIYTDPATGLTDNDVTEAINILNKEE